MNKVFIFSYDSEAVSIDEVTRLIDSNSQIVNWTRPMAGTFILVSELSPTEIQADIVNRRTKSFRFIVAEVTKRNGWLPKDTWEFMKNPKPADNA